MRRVLWHALWRCTVSTWRASRGRWRHSIALNFCVFSVLKPITNNSDCGLRGSRGCGLTMVMLMTTSTTMVRQNPRLPCCLNPQTLQPLLLAMKQEKAPQRNLAHAHARASETQKDNNGLSPCATQVHKRARTHTCRLSTPREANAQ